MVPNARPIGTPCNMSGKRERGKISGKEMEKKKMGD